MDEIDENIKIHSEEVRDILSDPPKSILLFGNTLLFGFVALLVLLSWVLKYPDIISGQITITTAIPPEKLVAKVSGRIEAILVKDKETVLKDTPLAIIENAANYNDVFLLKNIVDTIDINKTKFPFEKLKSLQLGEIESAYAVFQKESAINELNSNLQPYKIEGAAQGYESTQIKERLNLLESQRDINISELQLQRKDLLRYQGLFKKGIISTQEVEKQELLYLQSEKNFKGILNTISTLKSSLNELNRKSKSTQISEKTENVNLERNVIQSFYQLKKVIKDWELSYVLRSAIKGKITFLQIWAVHQNIEAGSVVFAVIPDDKSNYIGKLKAPALNSGKIKAGQDVTIRLSNYPDTEYGVIKGKITQISLTPDKDNNILIDVSLPNGLETSYKKQINFQQEMVGSADIITQDLRLIERLFYQFRTIFKRQV
ncbi:hemolysin [Flavobacterium collinsii]|uniref:HlyD family secretion protein n=1 Tax=Flavobacterium collinsii TaxID=1114861 RepID=UPI0022BCE80D|nr:HlyD family efflux transporter periplasmic adaptor subunit [Flavobacterium collinsii]GIQ57801.1 hemolysin [Flavobacterium collinsii]